MPTPPKESIGGFVAVSMRNEENLLMSTIQSLKDLIVNPEFESYDDDFKLQVTSRLSSAEEYLRNILNSKQV